MKVAFVLGTRPEIIKQAPVIRQCIEQNIAYSLIHTGQHYSYDMDRIFFEELDLPNCHHMLQVGSATHGVQTGSMLSKIEGVLMEEKPDYVLVQGDTNSALAGALAAVKLHIRVGHIEAGIRSYYKKMPEEVNRVMIDHIADDLYAPTPEALGNLAKEGLNGEQALVTGNTVVDALQHHVRLADTRVDLLKKLLLAPEKYVLVTAHREENVDNKERLRGIVRALVRLAEKETMQMVWPVHPRAKKMLQAAGFWSKLKRLTSIRLLEPLGYLDFILLLNRAGLVLTDSGGLQEESCILQVPCVTLRDNTERPETLVIGANVLVGADCDKICRAVKQSMDNNGWEHPFGDGKAAEKIVSRVCGQDGVICDDSAVSVEANVN